MSLTYEQARDEVFTLIKAGWDTTGFLMNYPDKPAEKPTLRTPWARTEMLWETGNQATLANHNNVRRYRRDGTIFVQIFTPVGEGLSNSLDLAKLMTDVFEGESTAGGVWFRNTRIRQVGSEGDWYQTNVLTNFTYDEIK